MSGSDQLPPLTDGQLTISSLRRYARTWNQISHDGTAGGEQYSALDFVDFLEYNLKQPGNRLPAGRPGQIVKLGA